MPEAEHQNRLAHETSPYLLQHRHNPVDWYPWGPEAFARAAQEDKPIFLSIGYAACHWCHVMERESFEDETVAAVLRRSFIAIKVDREERPDVDAIYMTATVALSGSGGWPMTVFMTPDQKPFFAGTYFPKTSRYGRPGFLDVAARIAELWKSERPLLLEQANELTGAILAQEKLAPGPIAEGAEALAVAVLQKSFDASWGGFGAAPKFPAARALSMLLRRHTDGAPAAEFAMVETTLDRMARGGIYDQLAGGFARYSTDARWQVPHFEKMLYDNAQLARVYAEAFQCVGKDDDARVARETCDYVARELQLPGGGYASATDADSEGVEGRYFVWDESEVHELLGADASAFCELYDVRAEGNWEGHNVLWMPRPLTEVAESLGLSAEALRSLASAAGRKLLAARQERIPPLCDDKVLSAWNGMMLASMAFVGRVLGEARYLESARRCADFLLVAHRRPDDGLYRTSRAGRAHIGAFLEDYAHVGSGLLELYEATGESRYLREALRLGERMVLDFSGTRGEFFSTAHDGEALVSRPIDAQDGATPAASSIAAALLVRLARHTDRSDLEARAERALGCHGALVSKHPRAFISALEVASLLSRPGIQVVLAATPGADDTALLLREIGRHHLPELTLAWVPDPDQQQPWPLLQGKIRLQGKATAYVCRGGSCRRPVSSVEELREELVATRERGA